MAQAPQRQSMRDRMREQAEKSASSGPSYIKIPDGRKASWFQPKAEEFELDFIPYEVTVENHPKGMRPGDLWPQRSIKVHYGIGAEEKAYVCPKTIGKPCPICERRALMSDDPTADEKLIKDLAPKDRTIYQVYDLKDEKKGLQLWDYSYHLFEKRLLGDINKTENAAAGRKRSSTPHGGFADLVGGQTLFVSFIEKKMGTNKFFECDRVDAEDREDYGDDVLDEAFNLDEIVEVLPYDKLKALFLAIDPKDAEKGEHQDDEQPTRGRRGRNEEPPAEEAPARGRRGTPPPEEPPAEAPSRGRRGATTPPPEEESTPAPTRGRRGTVEEPPAETPTRGRRGAATEPPPEEAPPSRPRRGAPAASDDPECIAGGVFGKDADMHDKCYDCADDTYAACVAKKNA